VQVLAFYFLVLVLVYFPVLILVYFLALVLTPGLLPSDAGLRVVKEVGEGSL
jgi:hypothetical protein